MATGPLCKLHALAHWLKVDVALRRLCAPAGRGRWAAASLHAKSRQKSGGIGTLRRDRMDGCGSDGVSAARRTRGCTDTPQPHVRGLSAGGGTVTSTPGKPCPLARTLSFHPIVRRRRGVGPYRALPLRSSRLGLGLGGRPRGRSRLAAPGAPAGRPFGGFRTCGRCYILMRTRRRAAQLGVGTPRVEQP